MRYGPCTMWTALYELSKSTWKGRHMHTRNYGVYKLVLNY
jgi:hypothetical protein